MDAPINMEVLEDALHLWLSEYSGLQTIWRNQSAEQPKLPSASLMILSGPLAAAPQFEKRTTTDLARDAGKEIAVEMCVPCRFTVSCQTYGQDAYTKMIAAYAGLEMPTQAALFRTARIAVTDKTTVTNITALMGASYQEQANMDITVGATLSATEYNGYIKTIQGISTTLGIDQRFGDLS